MSLFDGYLLRAAAAEAVASVSLSHALSCRCLVCRAALGDEAALDEVLATLYEFRLPAVLDRLVDEARG
jgi:hypothetical protein